MNQFKQLQKLQKAMLDTEIVRAAANADLEAEIECLEAQGSEVLEYLKTLCPDLPDKFESLVEAVRMTIGRLLNLPRNMVLLPSSGIVPFPSRWPKRFNGHCREACDMLIGPCCCGATHFAEEGWVQEALNENNARFVEECELPPDSVGEF